MSDMIEHPAGGAPAEPQRGAILRRRTVNGRTDGRPRRRCAGCGDELHAGDDALVQEAVFWGVQCGCADKVGASAAPVAEPTLRQRGVREYLPLRDPIRDGD